MQPSSADTNSHVPVGFIDLTQDCSSFLPQGTSFVPENAYVEPPHREAAFPSDADNKAHWAHSKRSSSVPPKALAWKEKRRKSQGKPLFSPAVHLSARATRVRQHLLARHIKSIVHSVPPSEDAVIDLTDSGTSASSTSVVSSIKLSTPTQLPSKVLNSSFGRIEPEDVIQVILWDVDNFCSFLQLLFGRLPHGTLVFGFGTTVSIHSVKYCAVLDDLINFHQMQFVCVPPGKNSADFILSHRAGMLDWVLPVTVPFNIISSDHGFDVIVQDLKRPIKRLDPRLIDRAEISIALKCGPMVYSLIGKNSNKGEKMREELIQALTEVDIAPVTSS